MPFERLFLPHINEQQTSEEMHLCKVLVTHKHTFCVSLSDAYIDVYASWRGN